jgi:putative hydrolase of the HAD superfamily
MRFAELDAVTVDGYGTLITVADPVPALDRALRNRGVERSRDEIRGAFAAEVAYYRPNAVRGRTPETLAALRVECARIFLEATSAGLEAESFADDFISAIVVEPVPRAIATVNSLRARGLCLAVVSNWDIGLSQNLERIGAASLFTTIVTTAEAGAAKPDPAVFLLALERLGVEPGRSLHVGDEPEDEQGALAAGMRFAHAPLAAVFEGWT